ncbi:MAG: methyltransferase type 11 [Nitrospirae bacterium GWC2_57_13]|jgi:SAM-dependent methyltransferase|nr:MAG: methyltransferase type 11 [Nitrospirae bacterium GWC2_57_13]
MPGVTTFDQHSREYEAWFEANPRAYEAELRAIRELLPKQGKGLEIGVGSGRFAAPLGIRYGVEPSKAMRDQARLRGIKVIKGVAESLPFTESEFDHCLMVTTVCFLDDIELAFSEAHRVLRPGGSFLIGFVDRDSPLGRDYLAKQDKSVFYQDATFYSTKELIVHLEKAGFSDFRFHQTLFGPLKDIGVNEPVKEGFGDGSFVVVRGERM